mmetsp:Transcript_7524/g.19041  ORF Transcript_7524/g.19041 Transcript_7524/m.19041 type:complete len:203 (+) Transcript_7524:272-880(+)
MLKEKNAVCEPNATQTATRCTLDIDSCRVGKGSLGNGDATASGDPDTAAGLVQGPCFFGKSRLLGRSGRLRLARLGGGCYLPRRANAHLHGRGGRGLAVALRCVVGDLLQVVEGASSKASLCVTAKVPGHLCIARLPGALAEQGADLLHAQTLGLWHAQVYEDDGDAQPSSIECEGVVSAPVRDLEVDDVCDEAVGNPLRAT